MSLIFIVALLVFGPEQLPKMARSVGRFVGRSRRLWDKIKEEAEDVLDDPEKTKQ